MTSQSTIFLISLILSVTLTGCSAPDSSNHKDTLIEENIIANTQDDSQNLKEDNNLKKINLIVNQETFTVTLANTDAANQLLSMLPLTLDMSDLNKNEKYAYLPTSLSTDPYSPNKIETGDLMLFGSDCIVLFYKDFSTSYKYTKLGKIENPTKLKEILGSQNVTISFQAN